MTKTINWRLKELPTAEGVADLVEQGVLTKEEARQILLKDKDEADKDTEIKALEEQIAFMEKVVDALSHNRQTTITYVPQYIERWRKWDNPWWNDRIMCSSGSTTASIGTFTNVGAVNGATMSLNTGTLN